MHPALSIPPGARLRPLLVLLLLALCLLAGVSVSQTHALHADAQQAAVVVVPALKQVHALARQVDEQRGMAALHLTLDNAERRSDLEDRLHAGRLQIERRMAAFAQRLDDDTDRAHHRSVAAALAAFWAAQDQLLAASRRGAADAAAAQQARSLLTGPAQQAYLQLRAAIEAWWSTLEGAAIRQAEQASTTAHRLLQLVWAVAALAALGVALAWAQWRVLRRPASVPAGGPALPADAALRGQLHGHLQALNAAVSAARRGEPGRAAGLSAHEARHLADQVAGAAQGLRQLIDRPVRPPAGPAAAQAAAAADTAGPDHPPTR